MWVEGRFDGVVELYFVDRRGQVEMRDSLTPGKLRLRMRTATFSCLHVIGTRMWRCRNRYP